MYSLSSLSILLASFVFMAKATPVPEAGTIFAVYPGWDMDNGSLQTIFNGTESACLHSCASTTTCVAYSYVAYGHGGTDVNPICVLKSTIDLTTFKIQTFDVSVGIFGACGTVNPIGPTICFTENV
ncbi:hypothetical protein K438DRAFT_1853180 [Mycena galopus ATCC 62051]|nr:hypothetical protein K438DRAFT_2029472 [Mycena galopus ATCC 62051]KAF8171033.1 hypothetical protein K438DRAFT_1853180 [Mycena galopus ATCC 62051]